VVGYFGEMAVFKRLPTFAYGLFCCAVIFATCLHAVGFVGKLIVTHASDGQPAGSFAGVVVDLLLLLALLILSRAARVSAAHWADVAPHGPRSDL
jgi:hypothetical protein